MGMGCLHVKGSWPVTVVVTLVIVVVTAVVVGFGLHIGRLRCWLSAVYNVVV
jgi:hypothetical protein